MPVMKSLEPIFNSTQATTFDEERARTEISKRVGALYGDCVAKLGASTAPNTILKAIPIASDEFHSEKIGEICQEQANLMNERAKSEGVPIRFEVMREKNTLYIVDGRYRLKEEAVEPAKAEFDVGVHYFDISHSTLEGHIAALGGANLSDADYSGVKEILVEAFAMKDRGEITDASHVGIVKNPDGSFELSQEGIVETHGRSSANTLTEDEPPNFTLNQKNVEMLTSRLLAEANVSSLEELMKDDKLLFKTLLKVLTRRKKQLAYVEGIGLTDGVDLQSISKGSILRSSSNQIGKIEVGEVISRGKGYSEFYAEVPGYGIERCRVEKGNDGFVFSVMGFGEDATIEPDSGKRKTRNPERTFKEAKGDCDEFALLAASYLKAIGFQGKVTLAEVRLTTGPNQDYSKNAQDHAFMIGIENKQGNDTFYRMDFTLKEKFEEFKVVRNSDGRIDGKASVEANYAPGELMEGQQRVKRVILHEGLEPVESYLYQVKALNLYNRLHGEISSSILFPSEQQKTELDNLMTMIDTGLEKNQSNSELYVIRGDLKSNWAATLSNAKSSNTPVIIDSAKEDYRCALGFENMNDRAHFRYGIEIAFENEDEARVHFSTSLTIDPTNREYLESLKNLER